MYHQRENGIAVPLIIFIVFTLVLVGTGVFYYTATRNNVSKIDSPVKPAGVEIVKKTTTETGEAESPFGKFVITSDVTTTEECDNEGCFSEKFSACTQTTLSAETPIGAIQYEILGPKDSGCEVKMMYTQNPNPEWVNKDMTCAMDNTIAFQDSVVKTFNDVIAGDLTCEGPLFNILTELI